MAVDTQEVVELYAKQMMTMQQVAERLGITKARVQQILRAQGVKARRFRRRGDDRPQRVKAYRAYQMTPETMGLIERLAELLGASRAAVVTQAVEEMADRRLKGWRLGGGDAKAGGAERRRRSQPSGTDVDDARPRRRER